MKLKWDFQRGGGDLRKNPFHGGGKDIFWNYTINVDCVTVLMLSCLITQPLGYLGAATVASLPP